MNSPFIADHLSEIHEADTLYDSHVSGHQSGEQNWYRDQRSYVTNLLNSWGMVLGDLPYSRDNQATVKCLAELISLRQKELLFRGKAKEDLSALTFEKDKYRSYMEQWQRSNEQQAKRIGRLENENAEIKSRTRLSQTATRKQRDEDKRMITMLRAKNQQILHEIKKKEQQTNRIKEQMKKSVGEKLNSAKNSFEVFENLKAPSPRKPNSTDERGDNKYIFLLERNQRQLNIAMKENAILREKLFQIRDQLVRFNVWIDREIFGEPIEDTAELPKAYQHKFYLNHNLLFKRESLRDQFVELIEITKDGLLQLRDICQLAKIARPTKSMELPKRPELANQHNFKKKQSTKQLKSQQKNNTSNNLPIRQQKEPKLKKNEFSSSENLTPRSMKNITQVNENQFKNSSKNIGKNGTSHRKVGTVTRISMEQMPSQKNLKNQRKEDSPFQDDLLSDVCQGDDSSIISHISVDQLGKSRFDKWDILYQDEE